MRETALKAVTHTDKRFLKLASEFSLQLAKLPWIFLFNARFREIRIVIIIDISDKETQLQKDELHSFTLI